MSAGNIVPISIAPIGIIEKVAHDAQVSPAAQQTAAQQKAVEHQLVVAVHALYGCGESLRLCLGVLFFLFGFHAVHLVVLFVALSFFKSTCPVACVNYYSFFNVLCQGIFSKMGCFSELVVV